jgi:hypothetical protein
MGVLHGRDLFSSKYPTAMIKDASKRLHFVPIKHTIGDYFMTKLDNKWYFFKIDSEVCEYRQSLTKSFKVYQYDTTHYRPIKSEIKELELLLKKNNLPKVGINLANVFRLLGNREKETDEFNGHDINEIIKKINNYDKSKIARIIPKDQSLFKNQMESLLNYLDNLGIEKIVTPVKNISNFIEGDLRAKDPGFLGTIGDQLESLEFESKKVNNEALGNKKAWLLPIALVMIVGLMAVLVYMAYESGTFDDLLVMIPDISEVSLQPPTTPPGNILNQYPSPEAAKAAIDAGTVSITDFPPEMRDAISKIKVSANP